MCEQVTQEFADFCAISSFALEDYITNYHIWHILITELKYQVGYHTVPFLRHVYGFLINK